MGLLLSDHGSDNPRVDSMTDQRKRSSIAFWTTVALLVFLYVASFGPACWLAARSTENQTDVLQTVYAPLIWLPERTGCEWLYDALVSYGGDGTEMLWVKERYAGGIGGNLVIIGQDADGLFIYAPVDEVKQSTTGLPLPITSR